MTICAKPLGRPSPPLPSRRGFHLDFNYWRHYHLQLQCLRRASPPSSHGLGSSCATGASLAREFIPAKPRPPFFLTASPTCTWGVAGCAPQTPPTSHGRLPQSSMSEASATYPLIFTSAASTLSVRRSGYILPHVQAMYAAIFTVNPALDDRPSIHATSGKKMEVEAEKDAKVTAAEERDHQRQLLMEKIAALDAEADQAAAAEDASSIRKLDDVPRAHEHLDDATMSFNESDFERVEDDDAYRTEDGFQETKKAKAPVTRAKKPKKGETRNEIEKITKAMEMKAKQEGPKRVVKKVVQDKNAAAASKTAGLSKAFLARSTNPQDTVSPSKLEIGGLTDEDAASTRPDLIETTSGKWINEPTLNQKRHRAGGPSAATVPVPKLRAQSRANVEAESKIPALSISASETKTPKKTKKVPGVKTESSSGSFTPDIASDVKGLPAFVVQTWESAILPAGYRALYISPETMTFGAQGAEAVTVKAFQTILDRIHPGNTFEIAWGDKICSRLNDRIRKRRSKIVQSGVDVVDALYKTEKYIGQPAVIRAHASWASRVDGPALYKIPTPEACPRDRTAQGYIVQTKRILESALMIQAVSPFLKNEHFVIPEKRADGTYDFSGLPQGLFSLAAAGIERGMKLYRATGVREALPKFTKAAGLTAVDGYMVNIHRFKVTRWESLLKATGNVLATANAEEEAQLTLDGLREWAYVPSSP
ncbi:hypothetical protein B0H14DRAFT_3452072 [Mycena olivaceomarginata]|nr:hypothetical protein B0H14DRAFT_3452072 [Mycena olivaceomarginata]